MFFIFFNHIVGNFSSKAFAYCSCQLWTEMPGLSLKGWTGCSLFWRCPIKTIGNSNRDFSIYVENKIAERFVEVLGLFPGNFSQTSMKQLLYDFDTLLIVQKVERKSSCHQCRIFNKQVSMWEIVSQEKIFSIFFKYSHDQRKE